MRRIVKELAVIALLGTFATAAPASIIITQDSATYLAGTYVELVAGAAPSTITEGIDFSLFPLGGSSVGTFSSEFASATGATVSSIFGGRALLTQSFNPGAGTAPQQTVFTPVLQGGVTWFGSVGEPSENVFGGFFCFTTESANAGCVLTPANGTTAPEPATEGLIALGLVGFMLQRRRRREVNN